MTTKRRIVWFSWKDMEHPLAGGAEVVSDQLLTKLVADGHEAVLLCGSFSGATSETTRNGYRIIRVGNRLSVYMAAGRYYRRNLKQWATFVVDECNTIPFFAGWYVGTTPGVLFFHMLCRQIWFYELPRPLGLIGYLAEPIYLRMLRKWPIITVSESTKTDLIRNGFNPLNISIISEGIDVLPVDDLATVKKYAQPTMLSFGTMRGMKRTLDQLRAFEIAKHTIPELKLIMAGDYSNTYGTRVVKAIKASPYRADIALLGRVDVTKRRELMQRSHALLVSSVKEGWGLVVTEAASQGTPSIVYDVDGLRDSVRSNKTGIITASNPTAMAEGIVDLLHNQDAYDIMRENGYAWSKQITFEQTYTDFKKIVNL